MTDRALALARPGTVEREQALQRSGNAGRRSGLLAADDVLARYDEALAVARTRGDAVAIGEALVRVGNQTAIAGEGDRARALLAEAVETLAATPGPALARAYAFSAEEELFAGDTARAIELADRALALVEDELDEVAVMSLHLRGDARCSMGDLDGGLGGSHRRAPARRGLRPGDRHRRVAQLPRRVEVGERGPGGRVRRVGAGARARGAAQRPLAGDVLEGRGALGALRDGRSRPRPGVERRPPRGRRAGRLDPAVEVVAQVVRTHVLLDLGRRADVIDPDALLALAERTHEVAAQAPALIAAASVAHLDGDDARATAWLERFETLTDDVAPEYRAAELVRAVDLAIALGRVEVAERLVASMHPTVDRDRRSLERASAALAEALASRSR